MEKRTSHLEYRAWYDSFRMEIGEIRRNVRLQELRKKISHKQQLLSQGAK